MARHGENIRKRKDGRWEGRYPTYSTAKGRKVYVSVYGSTYKEVKEKMVRQRVRQRELEQGEPVSESAFRMPDGTTGLAGSGQETYLVESGQDRYPAESGRDPYLAEFRQSRYPTGLRQVRTLAEPGQSRCPTVFQQDRDLAGLEQYRHPTGPGQEQEDRMETRSRRRPGAECGQGQEFSEKLLFGDMAEEWLSTVKATKKPSTYVKYSEICRRHLNGPFADMCITDINGTLVKEQIDPALSTSSLKSIYSVLNQILRSTSKKHLLVLPDLKIQGEAARKKPVEVLSRNEQKRLFPLLYHQITPCKMAVLLSLHTGLRLGELCALKWEDIDLEDGLLTVNHTVQRLYVEGHGTKTILLETSPKSEHSKREIPLAEEMVAMLRRARDGDSPSGDRRPGGGRSGSDRSGDRSSDDDRSCDEKRRYLFGGKKPLEPRTLQNHFKRFLKEAQLPNKNFHILRHTFATNCVEGGVDVRSLSEILGHADVQITLNRYVHPSMDTKRRYIEGLSAFYGRIHGQREGGYGKGVIQSGVTGNG